MPKPSVMPTAARQLKRQKLIRNNYCSWHGYITMPKVKARSRMLGHLAVVEEPRRMRLRSAWKGSGLQPSMPALFPSPSLSLVGKGQALLSAKIGEASGCRHSAFWRALGVLPRSGDLCISRTSIGQYV